MVSSVLASVLQSYLGKYLELSDTSISVGSEIRLNNVSLKESALSDLGLPVKCLHGKVSKLVIKIPWFNLFAKKTTIDIEGLHLLLVPSTAVKYDEKKEKKEQLEAKQKRLEIAEQARHFDKEKKKSEAGSDSFAERLVANIIKNLEVTIKRVHLRYEDKQTGSGRYPFAAGITLDSIIMNTTTEGSEPDAAGKFKLKIFKKSVELNSLALYWKPKAKLYSEDARAQDDEVDGLFEKNIGTRDAPISDLKYLLGPICSKATLQWCPNPSIYDYTVPEVELAINMDELCLSLTKYQYQDFVMLLQSFEFMTRASQFRKYKAKYKLEGLANFQGRYKDLWKFAFDSIYLEEITRRINNWSWEHMKKHITNCKAYRKMYKKKLTEPKPTDDLLKRLRHLEDILDEFNIRIQRQLAEREAEQAAKEKAESSSGIWGWFGGGNKGGKKQEESAIEANIKKLNEALTKEEKNELYEALDYQENAHHGIFPKSFVARKLEFNLGCLLITIRDDDLKDAAVLRLNLASVTSHVKQRPSADYMQLDMTMKDLTVTGFEWKNANAPTIVSTRPGIQSQNLLNFSFENNPPSNPDGNLDEDTGSLYDQRIKFLSNPLEMVYDSRTILRLISLFRTPDDLNLANLQHTAASKLKEYRATTTLGLQYVIENHNLVDVDIHIMSSYLILPHRGELTQSGACAIANLGSIKIKSTPITAETRSLKDISLSDLTDAFKKSLRDQAYDKFQVSLENMQLIVAMPNEEWRSHVEREMSPLFLLKPTSLVVNFHYCLIKSDPEMPLAKINGSLKEISINISDYRLYKLAQILDSLVDKSQEEELELQRAESEESMQSAMSSLANTGSLLQTNWATSSIPEISVANASGAGPAKKSEVQVTKLTVNFKINRVNLSLSQQAPNSNEDQELFHFTLRNMEASASLQTFMILGRFNIGDVTCEHLLLKTPTQEPVRIVSTLDSDASQKNMLLQLTYTDVKKESPDFQSVHDCTLKKLDVRLSTVRINLHQDAILDLVAKVTKFVEEISSNAKHLMAPQPSPQEDIKIEDLAREALGEDEPDPEEDGKAKGQGNQRKSFKRRTSMTVKTPANIARWAFRAKKTVSLKTEEIEFKVDATLEKVEFDFMTSQVHFASLQVQNLEASFVQTKGQKLISAQLVDFKVFDPTNVSSKEVKTYYSKVVESMDAKVFDASVTLYDTTPAMKKNNTDIVDVKVEVKMGRIKMVFLMKFINDFLAFLEPFSGAKEAVAERANLALEGATRTMIESYANATRAQLDIQMEAPLIIIPVHSKSKTTFIADLGTLCLTNRFLIEGSNIFDDMHLNLNNLQLCRAKLEEAPESNEVEASCLIIHPINFELDIKRNMSGAKRKEDPAEIKASGTLYEIRAEMSKSDYDILMAILVNNFSEKGAFVTEHGKKYERPNELTLGLNKSRRQESRTSLMSQNSRKLQEALKASERDQEARAVEFDFTFRGFKADLHSGSTPLKKIDDLRQAKTALARVQIKYINVKGHLLVSSAVLAEASLENLLLIDNRQHENGSSEKRITRLMETKRSNQPMMDITYNRNANGDQKVDVFIHSFILVGSVSYLLEIANFFVQDNDNKYEWQMAERETPVELPKKMTVFLEIEEPDIFLVENIEDINSDCLLLNVQLQFKLEIIKDQMSILSSIKDVRCHTCRFNPNHREETLAQILQPCTISFQASQNEHHGMRVDLNISDVRLNVSPHSILIIQNSVQAFISSMGKKETTEVKGPENRDDYSQLWSTKRFDPEQFWFLKADEALEAVEHSTKQLHNPSVVKDEQMMLKVNHIVIKIESGVGNNTIPLLLIESNLDIDARNWSSPRMSVIGSLTLEMAYYNSKMALWEPVIEPICRDKRDGTTKMDRWDMTLALQANAAEDLGSAIVSPSFDEGDGFVCPQNMPPLMSITLQSTQILEMTVTKSFLGVLTTLGESFAQITSAKKKELPKAPFIIRNFTGKKLTLNLDSKGFKYYAKDSKPGAESQIELLHDSEVCLFLFKDRSKQEDSEYISPLREQSEQAGAALRIKVQGEKGSFEVPVSKADKRFFPFPFRGDEQGDNHGMVSEVEVKDGCKFITLRTIIQIKNHFEKRINIFVYDGHSKYIKLASLEPDKSFNVPIANVYAEPYEFSFQIDEEGSNMGLESFNWRELIAHPDHSEKIECTNTYGGPTIFLNVQGSKEEIFFERTGKLSSVSYVLDIRPVLVLKNCLPVTLHYSVGDQDEAMYLHVEPGKSTHIQGVVLGKTWVTFKIFEFRETDWICRQIVDSVMPELSTLRFSSAEDTKSGLKLDLSIKTDVSQGTRVLSMFAPFWMINKTGKPLVYRGQDPQNIIYHPVEMADIPMMFSYTAKTFLGKRKATLKIEDSAWSDPFTLDTIEDAGKVSCKKTESNGKKQTLYIGVNIAMSKSSLTKIITFTPYYIILNSAEFPISIREVNGHEFTHVPPGDCVPFWPEHGVTSLFACVKGTSELTPAFSMLSESATLLRLENSYGAIHATSRVANSECLLTLTSYSRGLAPVQLINCSESCRIHYCEAGSDKQDLSPMQQVYYAWIDPNGQKKLLWSIEGYTDEYTNTLTSDGEGIIELDPGKYLAWVSFLDGMQRVLVFTDDPGLCYKLAHSTGERERIEQEINLSMQGIGISVVNNSPCESYELLYTSITSSDKVWEVRRTGKTRYKPLTQAQCSALERDFQIYRREVEIGRRTELDRVVQVPNSKDMMINYEDLKITAPFEGRIRRQFQQGLWFQMRTSAHQNQFHAKINRIQIDNQMLHCLFPVIMAPVPPPKSVIAESIPKSFIELSVLEYKSPEHTTMRQYKYVHALVQELHIKVDQGLIYALMNLFEEEEILDEDINEFLKEDLDLAAKPLKDIAKLQVTKGTKDFFDFLHLSPLKVHVSFSMTSYDSSTKIKATRRSNFLNLFMQSLGVTITDTDDIIFRLAYFERKHQFFTQQDLINEMMRHYTSQAIKQIYVVIFGLDVIGNPYGLVVGVTRSVEDLFYEPFQGAVEGPSEFAEGLVIGVRSVFSGVVGGAAGTFSKITGALGKGLASLTFDEKFQSKRRETIKKRGRQTVGEGIARSSKGLVMGLVDGVTGVALKPYEGARDEGVEGFFKGIGRGVAGLVARPTGGIADFASGTFDSFKRVTEVTEEIERIRPSRFIRPDGVVRNYNFREATGNKILKELDKGRLSDSDDYITHVEIEADRTANLFVTSKRIIFINYNQVMGTWTGTWEFEYPYITGPPTTGNDTRDDGSLQWYIIFKPKEEKKKILGLFGGSERGKKVFMPSREMAQSIARTVEELRTNQN